MLDEREILINSKLRCDDVRDDFCFEMSEVEEGMTVAGLGEVN